MSIDNPIIPQNVPRLVTQYAAPVTTDTVSVGAASTNMIINPAGTIAAASVDLPAVPLGGDGANITISSTQIITVLTLGAGAATLVGALTAFAANGAATYVYRAADTSWYRCG